MSNSYLALMCCLVLGSVFNSSCSSGIFRGAGATAGLEKGRNTIDKSPDNTGPSEKFLNSTTYDLLEDIRDYYAKENGDIEFYIDDLPFANMLSWTEQVLEDLVDNGLATQTQQEIIDESGSPKSDALSLDEVLEVASAWSLDFGSSSQDYEDKSFDLQDSGSSMNGKSVEELWDIAEAGIEDAVGMRDGSAIMPGGDTKITPAMVARAAARNELKNRGAPLSSPYPGRVRSWPCSALAKQANFPPCTDGRRGPPQ